MIVDRVTIDLDAYVDDFQMKALRAYHGLARLPNVEEVVVHISTGGRGLHIEAHFSEVLDDDARFRLRRNYRDDSTRAHLDEQRTSVGHAGDIFWSEKSGNDGSRERMPDIWAALDRLERTRAPDPARVKALAQRGRRGVWDTEGIDRASKAEPTAERADRVDPR